MASNGSGVSNDKSPWTQPWFITSGVVVGLIVILGLVLAVTGPSESGSRAERTPATPESAEPTASPAPKNSCGLPAGDDEVPTSAPAVTRWELVGTMAVPTSPDRYGPGRVKDGVRSCFARSPVGALYASVNVIAALSTREHQGAALRDLTASGPGRDRALAEFRAKGAAVDASTRLQVEGFSFVNYDQDSSSVDLVFRVASRGAASGASSFMHMTVTMRWEEADWRLVVARSGQPFDSMGVVPDLSGYVQWSGA